MAFSDPDSIVPPAEARVSVFDHGLLYGDGIPCRQQSLAPYDLYAADECFLTGTGAELIRVQKINGRPLGQPDRPTFTRLQAGFADLVARETAGALSLTH